MVGLKNVVCSKAKEKDTEMYFFDFFAHLLSSVIKQYFRFVIHSDEHCKGFNGIKKLKTGFLF